MKIPPSVVRPALIAISLLLLTSGPNVHEARGQQATEKATEARKSPTEGFEPFDRIVGRVDDEIITLYDVKEAARLSGVLQREAPGSTHESEPVPEMQQALNALINDLLILKAAEELELQAQPADVTRYLERIKAQNQWNDSELERNLILQGIPSLSAYKSIVTKEITKSRVFSVKGGSRIHISEEDVQRIIEKEYGGGTSVEEVRIAIITKKIPPGATDQDVAEAKRMAQWIWSQADAAPELFGNLARKYSDDDATRFDGGDVGFISRGLLADETLEEAAFATKTGQVGPILRTTIGFQFIKAVERRQSAVANVDSLRDEIYQQLLSTEQARVYKEWVQQLRDQHFVQSQL